MNDQTFRPAQEDRGIQLLADVHTPSAAFASRTPLDATDECTPTDLLAPLPASLAKSRRVDQRRRGLRTGWTGTIALVGAVLLAVGTLLGFLLLLAGPLSSPSRPTVAAPTLTAHALASPGRLPSTAGPQPTPRAGKPRQAPGLYAASATLSFIAAHDTQSSNPSMTACPTGCDFGATSVNHTASYSTTLTFSSSRQAALAGNIQVVNDDPSAAFECSGGPCSVAITWQGGPGWANCGQQAIGPLGPGGSQTISCRAYTSSGSIGNGQFTGVCFGCGTDRNVDISWSASGSFWWLALESPTDCHGALDSLERGAATNGLTSYFTSVTSGQVIASGPTIGTWGNYVCSPGIGSYTQSFVVGVSGRVTGLSYYALGAQSVARTRLKALLKPGYVWLGQSTCSPSTTSVSGTTAEVSCGESGNEAFAWGKAQQAGLAVQLAGISKSQALADCNSYAGVQIGTCAIVLAGGNGQIMPQSAGSIRLSITSS